MSRINQKVRDNTFIYYLFYILCFGCVALCEPIKNINYLYGIGLLMLLLKVGARNSHITLSVFLMMLLPYLLGPMEGWSLPSVFKYEIYMLTLIVVSKIPVTPVSVVNISAITCSLHAFITILFFLVPSLFFVYWGSWGANVFEKLPEGTEFGVFTAGVTSHYSANALYITIALFSIWCLYLIKKTLFTKIWVALVLLALILTMKRAHLIFGILTIGIVYLVENKQSFSKSIVKLLLLVGIVGFSGLVLYLIKPELFSIFDRFQNMKGGSGRTEFWSYALQFWSESPITGIGWMQFQERYSNFDWTTYNVHNVFIQILCETGILGMSCFLYFIYSMWKRLKFLLKNISKFNEKQKLLVRYSALLQVFFFCYCLTGNCLYDNTLFYFAIASGISVSMYNQIKQI